MAHQRLDDGPPQHIVGIEFDPPENRQLTGIKQGVILVERFDVLAVDRADLADRGDAEREHVAIRMGRIALEIAVQAPFTLGNGQLIVGLGEVIHADKDIPGLAQFANSQGEDLQTRIR